jgi:dehydrogenase/reductase SDR family protein 12
MAILNKIIEGALPLSFSRPGFCSRRERFDAGDLEVDLTGKICLVTGGNAGLGRAAARELASRGATLYLLCRNAKRGIEAASQIAEEAGNPRVEARLIDLSDLDSVRRFADEFAEERVDVLVHNAGVLLDSRVESAQGVETTWATAVSGPFLLTWLLAPRLQRAEQGRVIYVSSGGMYTKRLDLEDLQWHDRAFDGVAAYAMAKRAQVVLTELWAEKLGGDITVNAMHPGWADTGGVRRSLPRFYELTRGLLRSADEGADTIVWLAACPRMAGESGGFYFDREAVKTHKLPWTRESSQARDELWQLCLRQTGLLGSELPGLPRAA